jgi:ABC-2 type transport system permease protein
VRIYLTLVRRELGSYLASVTGYIIMASVLALLGLSFAIMLEQLSGEVSFAPITVVFFVSYYFWLILLLTAPVMTMRTFALEKASGTYETLMTTPVGDGQVVLAKFTGAMVFYAMTWIPFLAYVLLSERLATGSFGLDPMILVSTFLGLLLIGALYISLGCFASSLTQSQVVAAILSYGLGLALFVVSLRGLYDEGNAGGSAQVFRYLSMTEHMEDFARGVIDSRPVILYVSLTGLFLFLTWKVVEMRRWK